MELRMKNYWSSLKSPLFSGKFTKNQYRFKVWFAEKEGDGVFERGVDTPMHTMKLDTLLYKTRIKVLRLDMCTSMIP